MFFKQNNPLDKKPKVSRKYFWNILKFIHKRKKIIYEVYLQKINGLIDDRY